ncbi:hypothetical protein BU26DRAFT_508397 [Trematosphaeria pertusa]|uniref:JmjC domain-containing protein n=1 Tax=Trematosphaeria pertusa TaxID=390896 RepID=A0A6A6I3X2_9PLEO|nr:uncharacterized protein BU26DRAFT_508397 [Trematosphaeria pertusa]KAF2245041.1 hypothetical protein BU26DRAFT_508397 [Trematosphaeria pertusa]
MPPRPRLPTHYDAPAHSAMTQAWATVIAECRSRSLVESEFERFISNGMRWTEGFFACIFGLPEGKFRQKYKKYYKPEVDTEEAYRTAFDKLCDGLLSIPEAQAAYAECPEWLKERIPHQLRRKSRRQMQRRERNAKENDSNTETPPDTVQTGTKRKAPPIDDDEGSIHHENAAALSLCPSFRPSSNTPSTAHTSYEYPSILRKRSSLDEDTIKALRAADLQGLQLLLRPEDEPVQMVFAPFLTAMQSNRLLLWDGDPETSSWSGLDKPRLIRAENWGIPKGLKRLCLEATRDRAVNVYRQRGFANHAVPKEKQHYKISTWFKVDDPGHVFWALDVLVKDGSTTFPLSPPASLTQRQIVYTRNIEFLHKANITPKYTFVDTHNDNGLHVLSICGKRCTKLWVIHPPTSENMKAFYRYYGHENTFGKFEPLAKGGLCFLQFPHDAIYLPPGTLHTIYTIEGGCLTGTTWASNTSLFASAQIFEQDVQKGVLNMLDSFLNLVRSLHCAVQDTSDSSRENMQRAMELICELDMDEVWEQLRAPPKEGPKRGVTARQLWDLLQDVGKEMQRHGFDDITCGKCSEGIFEHVNVPDPRKTRSTRSRKG